MIWAARGSGCAKWTARYDPDDPGWARGPLAGARDGWRNRTAADVEAQVLAVRARLEANPWAQVGAPAIAWELEKLGARACRRCARSSGSSRAPGATRRRAAAAGALSKGDPVPGAGGRARRRSWFRSISSVRATSTAGCAFTRSTRSTSASHHAGIEIVDDRVDERVLAAPARAVGPPRACRGRDRSSTTAARSSRRPASARSCASACTRAPRRCSSRRASRGATARSSTSTTPSTSASSATSASAAARSSPTAPARSSASTTRQHRYRATGGRAPDETTPRAAAARRWPPTEIPAGWPAARSDRVHPLHPLRPQAAAARPRDPDARRHRLPIPHRHARPRPRRGTDNLLVSDEHGELITTARLARPRAADPDHAHAPRARRSASPYGLLTIGAPTNACTTRTRWWARLTLVALRAPHHRRTHQRATPTPLPGNDPLADPKTQ